MPSAAAIIAVVPAIGAAAATALSSSAHGALNWSCALVLLYALIPAVAAACGATLAALAQSGGLNVSAVAPKFERINPVEGLKRMISRESLTHVARAAAAFTVAVAAMIPCVPGLVRAIAASDGQAQIAASTWHAAQEVVFAAAAVGMVFALAEYGVARRAWLKKLKMTFEELKRDVKEHDGDPAARSRRKALHRNLIRGALNNVKDASFVVANPTHVAVALEYRPPLVPVPRVLVRAVDDGAMRVRELAARHHIPVVENIQLARALYRDTDVGQEIPHEHFVAVAEIVAALTRSGILQ